MSSDPLPTAHPEQNFWLNRSALVLSLLVALVSVLSAAVPAMRDVFRPRESSLILSAWFFTEHGLSLVLNNTGRMPGYVSSCKVVVEYSGPVGDATAGNEGSCKVGSDGKRVWDFNFNLDEPSKSRVVNGDTLQEIFFKTDKQWMNTQLKALCGDGWERKNLHSLTAHFTVKLTQHGGREDSQEWTRPLGQFYYSY